MRCWNKSVVKFGYEINEDFAISSRKKNYIAVSDGAGGGGVFADRWSRYLCENLPKTPITDFKSFDSWIDSIWEDFYNQHEELAKLEGGMFLRKFYEEGSFATIAAVWIDNDMARWITYGDSVVFMYNTSDKTLLSSINDLSEFNNPPYLVSTSNPLSELGFKSGSFKIHTDDYVFCASDALSHYVIMMYQLFSNGSSESIEKALSCQTRNSQIIGIAKDIRNIDFGESVNALLRASRRKDAFQKNLKTLYEQGLIALDDYSISAIQI